MPRPRRDGTPAAAANRCKLNDLFLQRLKPRGSVFRVWDTQQRGLVVQVQPSGSMTYKVVYHHGGRPRWYTIGRTNAVSLTDARRIAARTMLSVLEGKDPQADRTAARSRGSFEELATRYVEEHAKRHNKSWTQAAALVRRHLIPRWGKLQVADISRADVKAAMAAISAPVVANQTLAAASAIYSWAVKQEVAKTNPCQGVDRNPTKDRERVLADGEIAAFWSAFDDTGLVAGTALKLLLLTGQRPGEVIRMRTEHIADGWWTLPGEPIPALRWNGTKNGETHRVWLPAPAKKLLEELNASGRVFAKVGDLAAAMRTICAKLKAERATPHDLRRTHGTTIAALGFGRDAMNRVQNHREGGIASVYDRHSYAEENKKVMEAVAARIMSLATDETGSNVIAAKFKR